MPLKSESLLKIYRANRLLGSSHPIIVTTGDTTHSETPFEEFYVFHSIPGVPFLFRRTRSSASDEMHPFDFGQFPEVFSAQALLASAVRSARDLIEFQVSQRDRALHRELFWSASPISYDESDDLPLIEFRMFRRFVRERAEMIDFTRSDAIKALHSKLSTFPEITQHHEPGSNPGDGE